MWRKVPRPVLGAGRAAVVLALIAALSARGLEAQERPGTPPVAPHVQRAIDSLAAEPRLPPIAVVVVAGDVSADSGTVEMLIRLAPGAWIRPHRHNVTKEVEVLLGALLMGHGTSLDTLATHPVMAGRKRRVEAETMHYEGGTSPSS